MIHSYCFNAYPLLEVNICNEHAVLLESRSDSDIPRHWFLWRSCSNQHSVQARCFRGGSCTSCWSGWSRNCRRRYWFCISCVIGRQTPEVNILPV